MMVSAGARHICLLPAQQGVPGVRVVIAVGKDPGQIRGVSAEKRGLRQIPANMI